MFGEENLGTCNFRNGFWRAEELKSDDLERPSWLVQLYLESTRGTELVGILMGVELRSLRILCVVYWYCRSLSKRDNWLNAIT